MRELQRGAAGLFLLMLSLALLVLAAGTISRALSDKAAQSGAAPIRAERIFAVNVQPITLSSLQPEITAYGEVLSRRSLELRAANAGEVIMLAPEFRDGGKVTKGDVLFEIDPSAIKTRLELTKSALDDAKAELAEAKDVILLLSEEVASAEQQFGLRDKALERQKSLKVRGVGTEAAVEAAELAVSAAHQAWLSKRSALSQARARISRAKIEVTRQNINLAEETRNLTKTTVRAEFDGVLSDVTTVAGRRAKANEKLATLVDLKNLEIAFRLSNEEYSRLVARTTKLPDIVVTVRLASQDTAFLGRLERVNAIVGQGQTGREIYARLDGDLGDHLRPGDFVAISVFEPPLEQVVAIPKSSINAMGDVYVLGPDNRLEEIRLTVLRRQGDDLIVSGNIDGRELVVSRSPLLGSGVLVRPIRQEVNASQVSTKIRLAETERQKMIAFVTDDTLSPNDKAELLNSLSKPDVPKETVEKIKSRMGG